MLAFSDYVKSTDIFNEENLGGREMRAFITGTTCSGDTRGFLKEQQPLVNLSICGNAFPVSPHKSCILYQCK